MKPEKITEATDFVVRAYGEFLATRAIGRAARNDLEDKVQRCGSECVLIVDFAGVEAMTISFTDEFIGRFYDSLGSSDRRPAGVLLEGLNEETSEAVSICLERRDLVAVTVSNGQPVLLGKAEFLQTSYAEAVRLGTFGATEFAAALQITPQNANNRLKRLTEAGAIRRQRVQLSDRGGKEFVYRSIVSAPSDDQRP
jgi:hypothetical protein